MREIALLCTEALLLFMLALYIYARYKKDISIIDIGWGFGFAMLAIILLAYQSTRTNIGYLVGCLVIIWGVRLGVHIGLRKIDQPEDWRYARWRKVWGEWFYVRSFLQVFLLQGLLIFVISAPLLVAINSKQDIDIGYLQILGVIVWLIGFIFEAVADRQLSRFVAHKKPKQVMQSGLWKYSRHPNYFGEVTQWWGLWLIVADLPHGILALISPITITLLIIYVSGIPLLENKYRNYPEFKKYMKKTSKFIPQFPKS